jgi:hypothetical protein
VSATPRTRAALLALLALAPLAATGCRQKMAEQPYNRPLSQSDFFADKRASRPLERGVIHVGQHLESDPMVTGLTEEEWNRSYEYATAPVKLDAKPTESDERKLKTIGAPRFDPTKKGDPKVYVDEFPFAMTNADLRQGQEQYGRYCVMCHGPLGNGQGKIWERGYLIPTSFHPKKVGADELDYRNKDERRGVSRGYELWGHVVPMPEVPVGYYFEVITRGYGGMPSYSAQITPENRWRIIAYVRLLQLSQTDAAKLPPELKKLVDEAGGKK